MTKQKLNWPALDAVPHHVVADSTWNGNIETFAPDYMRHVPRGYADKYPMTGKLKTSVDNIQSFMESVVLPEIMVTPSKKIGGKLNYFDYFK